MGKKKSLKNYRLIPLLIGSMLIFALVFCVILLIWSVIVYLTREPITSASLMPDVMWLLVLAISTLLMTAFTRGGTVFPGAFMALVSTVVSCFYASPGTVTFGGILIKLLLSLITAIIFFIIGKLLFRRPSGAKARPPKRQKVKTERRPGKKHHGKTRPQQAPAYQMPQGISREELLRELLEELDAENEDTSFSSDPEDDDIPPTF